MMASALPDRSRPRALIVRAVVATLALVISFFVAVPTGALAAPTSDASQVVAPASLGGGVQMADLSQFQPGNIISDAAFFNKGTMSEAQIQAFLESKVPRCQSGYTCMRDWYDTSRTTAADAMCGAYSGGVRERASTIIYKVAQACGINPQVLLVTLQKEQGLVTHDWPSDWRYERAMGQGCPDTAGCDVRYLGFFNQVYGAAWQFKRYANPAGTNQYFTWYAPGKTWNVRYSPDASCGSSPVYIQNQATANLYYYTPYQPNAAALAAGYGDSSAPCVAFGNRNFYNYFTDWFGGAQSAAAFVARSSPSGTAYLVSQGTRYRLPTDERAAQFTWIGSTRTMADGDISALPDGGDAPRAIRTISGNLYLLDSGNRFRIGSCSIAADYGWNCQTIPLLTEGQIGIYHDGGALERVIRTSSSSWLVQQKVKREILDLGLLPRFGIPAAATVVSQALASEYTLGVPVLGPGVYGDGSGRVVAVTDASTYSVPEAALVPAMLSARRTIQSDSLAKIAVSATLPVRVKIAERTFLLSDGGWLAVDAYGDGAGFPTLPAGALSGMPTAGTLNGPHFARELSDSQVYLASSGSLQAMSDADQAWVRARFGVAARVWVFADGALALPEPAAGISIVKSADGVYYLVDRSQRFRLSGCGQVADLGITCTSVPTATASSIAALTDRGSLNPLVRSTTGPTWLVQGGTRREVPDPSVLARYGIGSATSVVSPEVVAALTVGDPVLAAGAYTDSSVARAVLVTGGGTYSLTDAARLPIVVAGVRTLTADSFAKITVGAALPVRVQTASRSLLLSERGWLQVDPGQLGGDKSFTVLPVGSAEGVASAGSQSGPLFARERSSSQEFLVSGGSIQPVAGASEHDWIAAHYGVPNTTWTVADGGLAGIGFGPGYIARNADGTVSLYDTGVRYQITCTIAADFGKPCGSLQTFAAPASWGIRDGGSLATLLADGSGRAWLVQAGSRREVPDRSVLAQYGIGSASTSVSDALLSTIPVGDPVLSAGLYDDGAGNSRLVTPAGAIYSVPANVQITAPSIRRATIAAASLAKVIAKKGAVPLRIANGSTSFVLSPDGWLSVPTGGFGSLGFIAADADLVSALPRPAGPGSSYFLREATGTTLYLASGGLLVVPDEATKAWISATYGVPPTIWIVVDGALR